MLSRPILRRRPICLYASITTGDIAGASKTNTVCCAVPLPAPPGSLPVSTMRVSSAGLMLLLLQLVVPSAHAAEDGVCTDGAACPDGARLDALRAQATTAVIGGGLSGLTAALELLEAGRAVVLVDKRKFLGGNSAYASSGINGGWTDKQASPPCGPPTCTPPRTHARTAAPPHPTHPRTSTHTRTRCTHRGVCRDVRAPPPSLACRKTTASSIRRTCSTTTRWRPPGAGRAP